LESSVSSALIDIAAITTEEENKKFSGKRYKSRVVGHLHRRGTQYKVKDPTKTFIDFLGINQSTSSKQQNEACPKRSSVLATAEHHQ
jgi:hypothetical protein